MDTENYNMTLQEKKKKKKAEMNPISIHEDAGLIPGLTQQVRDLALP